MNKVSILKLLLMVLFNATALFSLAVSSFADALIILDVAGQVTTAKELPPGTAATVYVKLKASDVHQLPGTVVTMFDQSTGKDMYSGTCNQEGEVELSNVKQGSYVLQSKSSGTRILKVEIR